MDRQFADVADRYGFDLNDPQLARLNRLGLTADRFQAICQSNRLLTVVEVRQQLDRLNRGIAQLFGVKNL